MKLWIEERKEQEIKTAMKNAISTYSRIEKSMFVLDKLDSILASEDISLENMLENKFHCYSGYGYLQIYSYEKINIAETVKGILLAMVEVEGEGKREKSGTEIKYSWADFAHGMRLEILVSPEATGCKLVKKTIEVPAQPATTKAIWEVECYDPIILEEEE